MLELRGINGSVSTPDSKISIAIIVEGKARVSSVVLIHMIRIAHRHLGGQLPSGAGGGF